MGSGAVDVVIDCRRMEFMDSAGVGALLDINKQLIDRVGALICFGVMGSVLQTLSTTRLDRLSPHRGPDRLTPASAGARFA